MDIRQLKPSDISNVSVLHMRTLPSSTARIGNPYLKELYKTLDKNLCFVAVDHSTIVGVITATVDLAKTQKKIVHLLFSPRIILTIFLALIKRRVTLTELTRRMITENQIVKIFPTPYATILTFFVDKNYQHKGIGTKLLKALVKKLPKKISLFVDTELSNTHAIRWYTTRGFHKQKSIRESIVMKLITPPTTKIVG